MPSQTFDPLGLSEHRTSQPMSLATSLTAQGPSHPPSATPTRRMGISEGRQPAAAPGLSRPREEPKMHTRSVSSAGHCLAGLPQRDSAHSGLSGQVLQHTNDTAQGAQPVLAPVSHQIKEGLSRTIQEAPDPNFRVPEAITGTVSCSKTVYF